MVAFVVDEAVSRRLGAIAVGIAGAPENYGFVLYHCIRLLTDASPCK